MKSRAPVPCWGIGARIHELSLIKRFSVCLASNAGAMMPYHSWFASTGRLVIFKNYSINTIC